jgi:hypothetical protein
MFSIYKKNGQNFKSTKKSNQRDIRFFKLGRYSPDLETNFANVGERKYFYESNQKKGSFRIKKFPTRMEQTEKEMGRNMVRIKNKFNIIRIKDKKTFANFDQIHMF